VIATAVRIVVRPMEMNMTLTTKTTTARDETD
jgi:hypothetical protein